MRYFFPHLESGEVRANFTKVSGWDINPTPCQRFQVRCHEFHEDTIVLDFLESAELAHGIAAQANLSRI